MEQRQKKLALEQRKLYATMDDSLAANAAANLVPPTKRPPVRPICESHARCLEMQKWSLFLSFPVRLSIHPSIHPNQALLALDGIVQGGSQGGGGGGGGWARGAGHKELD